MKNTLNYIVLSSLAALVVATAAETFGVSISSSLPYAIPFSTFVVGLVLMTFRADYTPKARSYEPRAARPILLPANEVFAVNRAPVSRTTPVAWTARHRQLRRELVRN